MLVCFKNDPEYWINKTFIKTFNSKIGYSTFECPIFIEGFLCEDANNFKLILRKINFLAKLIINKEKKNLKAINYHECFIDLFKISEVGFTDELENVKFEFGKIANEFWNSFK